MAQTDTPFTAFWAALNSAVRHSRHMPELRYAEARRLWERAKEDASATLRERMAHNDY